MKIEVTEREYWRTLRKQKKIKLWQIAEVLGCSIPFVSMYENEKCFMQDEYIKVYRQFINDK